MLIALDPVVLTIGPLAVRWFGLLALVGLGLTIWRSLRALERERLPRQVALDALAWGLPAGLIAARLVHMLGWWDYYLTHTSELGQLNIDGLSLWGGLLGGGVIAFARLRSRRDPLRRRRILDVVAPNVALGIAVGRLGAFLDGHGQGVPSDLPWATRYTNPLAATPDFGVGRQPAQLYDALVALGVWVILRRLPRRWPPGSRVAVFLVLYGSARLLLGAVRLDPSFLFGLQIEQILALGALGFGLWYGLRPILVSQGSPAVPVQAVLYGKPDCHLCTDTLRELERLRSRYPHTLEVIDIGIDDNLVRRYWDRIPVLNVGGREYDAPLVPTVVEQALRHAAAGARDGAGSNTANEDAAPTTATPSRALQ